MRTGFRIAFFLAALAGGGVLAADAHATGQTISAKEAKKAQKAAAESRHDLLKQCRKQSYARNPGGEYYDSGARAREIEQCYMNGGRLM